MVVAARALDGHGHRSTRDHVNSVIDDVMSITKETAAERKESECGERSFVTPER